MIRKIIGIAVCFTAIVSRAAAQELGIELGGGLQGMQYQLQNGLTQPLPGGSLGLNYTFRLSNSWGLLTGISGGLYRTQAGLQDGTVFTYGQVDDAGSAFQYSIKTEGYKETQQFFAVSVPLLLHYHTPGAGTQWYFDGGGKVFLPFNTSIQVSADQLSLSGYYPDFNLAVSNLPQHGFGTVNGWRASASTQLKPAAALSVATGISFGLSPGTRLYAGLYLDYGLTDLKSKSDSMPIVTYSPAGINKVQANSVLNMSNAGQAKLLSFGLQVRMSFGFTHPKPVARSKTKKEPQLPASPDISDDSIEVIQRPVLFGIPGETAVSDIQKQHLDEVADILKQYPGIRISIAGHICNSDKTTENKKVGTVRAEAVALYLHSKGIDRSRMDISADSESHPYLSYDPAANYRNRKAVITVE